MRKLGSLKWRPQHIPQCSLCGEIFLGKHGRKKKTTQSTQIFTENVEWSNRAQQDGFVSCRPADLNEVYFRIPSVWERLYRAILQNCRGDRRTYHVSGVALYGPWDRFLMVPRRRDEVIMGDPHQTPEKFVEAYVSSLEYDCMDFNPCGYAVHERCWVLMARVIDVRLVKKNLDLFVKALCQRKQERIYELDKKICEEGQWDILEHEYGDKFVKNPRKYLRSYEKNMECSDTVFSERDPLNIPENMLQVFPQWDLLIPNTYWRAQFPRDIILNMKKLRTGMIWTGSSFILKRKNC
ncbi:hypothetical protein VTN96DRAFT_6120 [Rasamsonia emersonii]